MFLPVYIKKLLKMSKKKKKNKKIKNNPHYYNYQKKASSEDIKKIAYDIFGSLYFNPSSDWYRYYSKVYLYRFKLPRNIMTTIIGIQAPDYALICSDSRISTIDEGGFASQITTLGSNTAKVAENGRYLLGAAGDMRAINILHHAFIPPVVPAGTTGKKLDNFITTKYVPALRECFEKQGYASPDNDSATHIAQHSSTVLTVVYG
jgi:hypothetical protein